jgi:hypothetical protein
LWNGHARTTTRWPDNRLLLFDKREARFIGMVECTPYFTRTEKLPLTLIHQPRRKSYGLKNNLLRRQSYWWREVIAETLLLSPLEVPRWRWPYDYWPPEWEQLRSHPIRTGCKRLVSYFISGLSEMAKKNEPTDLDAAFNSALYHFMLGILIAKKKTMALVQRKT